MIIRLSTSFLRRAALVGLGGLALLNAVLVPLALRVDRATSEIGLETFQQPTSDLAAGAAPVPVPVSVAPPASGTAAAPAPTGDVMGSLTMAAGMAVFAPGGTCGPTPVALRLSRDAGRTWQVLAVPATAVLRVRVVDAQKIWLVGTDGECHERLYYTADRGANWRMRRTTDGAWHRLADPAANQLHAPAGTVTAPCGNAQRVSDVIGLTTLTAAVRCQDGSVHQTSNGGRAWRAAHGPGVSAVAFVSRGSLVGVEPGGVDCTGLRVSRRSTRGWEPLGCVADAEPDAPVALSFADASAGLLVSASQTFVTMDGGRTWQRRDVPPSDEAATRLRMKAV